MAITIRETRKASTHAPKARSLRASAVGQPRRTAERIYLQIQVGVSLESSMQGQGGCHGR